ncbi:phosphoserine phosphatase [Dechloromonas denitrificans]|uniref:Phosphoserine phosphatase n=1 Tax=Dechloromonas denitrificans TaxID=281362 RepID=A0A133XJB1_9RHOO|nr:HAD family hydrolase [Dechloromonas denitrificans]KXB30986.1 phosphoserine phosphatase [Dechloromonas denitrificans]
MNLALFDLDNTLLSGDSDFEWAQFLISKGVVDREIQEAKNIEFYEHYKAGTLDIYEFLNFQLSPLTRHSRAELDAWHREYMARHIRPIIGAPARALVKQHLDNGDLCAIVTATNSFVTGPIARELGIPHLIGTIPAVDLANGAFSGAPRGTPSFQAGKIERVEAWLESLGLWWDSFDDSFFYSDSHNDLPLMRKVKTPVAVDPDDKLHQYGTEQGWKVISLR